MDATDVWTMVRDERLALADLLEGLKPEQWSAGSLCAAWTVKDVAAHVAPTLSGSLREFLAALVRNRLDPNRASEQLVRRGAAHPAREIVADLRDHAGRRAATPGLGPASQLAEVLVHTLDIAVPLGLEVQRPAAHWREALAWLVGPRARAGFVPAGRPALTLVADDVAWSHGDGPAVHGTAAALALALCGREALLHQLTGPGAAAFADWVRA